MTLCTNRVVSDTLDAVESRGKLPFFIREMNEEWADEGTSVCWFMTKKDDAIDAFEHAAELAGDPGVSYVWHHPHGSKLLVIIQGAPQVVASRIKELHHKMLTAEEH